MDALMYKGTNVSKDVEIMRLVQGKKIVEMENEYYAQVVF